MEHKKFTIQNTTIDLGTDGKYAPGSEARLAKKLQEMKNGEDLFNSLVSRGAIQLKAPSAPVETEAESSEKKTTEKQPSSDGSETVTQSEASEEDQSTDNQESANPEYEGTGRYEYDHYGGGHCNIVDPEGNKIDYIRGEDKAQAKVKELNEQHNL